MSREKQHYRDMLFKYHEQGVKDLVTAKEAMHLLGIGHSKFDRLKREGEIKLKAGMVAIGDIARITCGG